MEGRPDIHKFLYQARGGIPPSHCVVKTVGLFSHVTCRKNKGGIQSTCTDYACACVLTILVELAEQNRLGWRGRLLRAFVTINAHSQSRLFSRASESVNIQVFYIMGRQYRTLDTHMKLWQL